MRRRRQRLDGSPRKIWRRRERFPHPTSPPPRLVARITIQVPANIGSDSASTRTSEFSAQASPDCYRESPQAGQEPSLPPTRSPSPRPEKTPKALVALAERSSPAFGSNLVMLAPQTAPRRACTRAPARVTRAPSPTPTCNDRAAHHRPPHITHCPPPARHAHAPAHPASKPSTKAARPRIPRNVRDDTLGTAPSGLPAPAGARFHGARPLRSSTPRSPSWPCARSSKMSRSRLA